MYRLFKVEFFTRTVHEIDAREHSLNTTNVRGRAVQKMNEQRTNHDKTKPIHEVDLTVSCDKSRTEQYPEVEYVLSFALCPIFTLTLTNLTIYNGHPVWLVMLGIVWGSKS